ncbi:MAG: FAD-dependent oxidoreductase [Myxococcota bacterium]
MVGAGLAGLAAAWELRAAGREVVVLERDHAPGGRARGAVSEGFVLEPLSPVLSSADRELLRFVSQVGVQDELLPLRPVNTAQVMGGRPRPIDPRRLADLVRLPGVRAWQGLRLVRLPRLMTRYGARLDPALPERAADLDDRSVADFARLYFGRSVLERWLAPFLTSATLADEREASRVQLLLRHRRHFAARRALPRAALAELAEAAAAGLTTLYEARVTRVEPRDGGGLLVTYQREGRERIVEAEAVALALPPAEALRVGGEVLTTGEREMLADVRFTGAVTLCVATCRPLSPRPLEIRVPHVEGLPLETALLEPGMAGGRIPDGYGMVTAHATGAYGDRAQRLPDETLEKELLDALERIQPGVRATVDFTRVFRTGAARPRFDVGHYRRLRRYHSVESERLAEGRRLVVAGDWRMEPSWNGAVASGVRAAQALLGAST